MIWASVKQFVKKHNVVNGHDIQELISQGFEQIDGEFWSKCVQHCDKLANDYWQLDYFIDDLVDNFGNLSVDDDKDSTHECNDARDDDLNSQIYPQ